MHIENFSLKKGFSLIELLLVILITSFLALYGIRLINESILNNQAQKTVNQMFNIKNAILSYYDKNRFWPKSLFTDLVPEFLPSSGLCSSFIGPSSQPQTGCQAGSVIYKGNLVSLQGGYYDLFLNLPSDPIARKLKMFLPDSWLEGKTLHMAIPAPTSFQKLSNHGWIVSAGAVNLTANNVVNIVNYSQSRIPTLTHSNLGPQVYLPNCPAGYEGHLFLAPFNYQISYVQSTGANAPPVQNLHVLMATVGQAGFNSSNPFVDKSTISTSTSESIVSYYQNNNQTNTYPCNGSLNNIPSRSVCGYSSLGNSPTLPISLIYPKDAHNNLTALVVTSEVALPVQTSHMAYFMTYCLPKGHWATNYIDPMWAQDGQCTKSWLNYNHNNLVTCNIANPNQAGAQLNVNNIPNQEINYGWQNADSNLSSELLPVGNTQAF